MNYLIKILDYFNKNQFEQELDELRKNYYVVGYTIKSQENTAEVRLVKKGEEHDEVHTSKL